MARTASSKRAAKSRTPSGRPARGGAAKSGSRVRRKPRARGLDAGNGSVARTTISVQGARVHNLKDIDVEIPRDKLIVVTGLSGSGKSSLAFDTIYAEGQRRYMESLSTYAKRFIAQVQKPDVDFMFGLSPVISIEQKTVARNPRSTVGTLTDISSYLNLLFATSGEARCPYTDEPTPVRTASQILETLLSLPADTEIELHAPVFEIYGEDMEVLLNEVRRKGCRRLVVDGTLYDLADEVELDVLPDTPMFAVVDRLVVDPAMEKQIRTAIDHALLVGDSLMSVEVVGKCPKREISRFRAAFGSKSRNLVYGDIVPDFFMFNNPESACRTCGGIGKDKATHPDLLVPDPHLSLREGCFVREAFSYSPDNWTGYMLCSLTRAYDLDLDTPWRDLSDDVRQVVLYGAEKRIRMEKPPESKVDKKNWIGRDFVWTGIASRIERSYRRYRQKDVAHSWMEAWLDRVMVEHECHECRGTRLRPTRMKFGVAGRNIHEFGLLHFDELRPFLDTIRLKGKHATAGDQVIREMAKRLDLLLGIGLDYLNFNRGSGTLSGGEAQRIRLSTQIGSGLMGMLYVLDEPSIGLHPKDNAKMIATLKSLRDIGNTVVVVEHDEATIREADHIVEMGPGPGLHGGEVVVQGTLADVLKCRKSPTGQYLSGARQIEAPDSRRPPSGKSLVVRGARENNLKNIDVDVPLGLFVCITGASGSGKSTLVKEIIYKRLWKERVDSRTLPGDHDDVEGLEYITAVVSIDQSPIGRNSRSNPATYIGFYDNIRSLFAETEISKSRGYKPGQFSFNKKGGRCEECQGEGTIRTKLYFMPDVEVVCAACKGKRYNAETLEVIYEGKTIADILDTSIEEGVEFFAGVPTVGRKIAVLDDLGIGYLTLGQSATTLSGGEAQRIKLATELSKLQRRNYILDEPTTGLHMADISRLLECLQRLVDAGHSVVVIEHHLDVIKSADYVVDLGPEGGRHGGEVVAAGPPEQIASSRASHTGRYLKRHLNRA